MYTSLVCIVYVGLTYFVACWVFSPRFEGKVQKDDHRNRDLSVTYYFL